MLASDWNFRSLTGDCTVESGPDDLDAEGGSVDLHVSAIAETDQALSVALTTSAVYGPTRTVIGKNFSKPGA